MNIPISHPDNETETFAKGVVSIEGHVSSLRSLEMVTKSIDSLRLGGLHMALHAVNDCVEVRSSVLHTYCHTIINCNISSIRTSIYKQA